MKSLWISFINKNSNWINNFWGLTLSPSLPAASSASSVLQRLTLYGSGGSNNIHCHEWNTWKSACKALGRVTSSVCKVRENTSPLRWWHAHRWKKKRVVSGCGKSWHLEESIIFRCLFVSLVIALWQLTCETEVFVIYFNGHFSIFSPYCLIWHEIYLKFWVKMYIEACQALYRIKLDIEWHWVSDLNPVRSEPTVEEQGELNSRLLQGNLTCNKTTVILFAWMRVLNIFENGKLCYFL